jgi:type III restriction enzyme
MARKQKQRSGGAQGSLDLEAERDAAGQRYSVAGIVDEIRQHLATWRAIPNQNDWGVTPSTARLLAYWRNPPEEALRPFFCQLEASETIIWLTEVARRGRRQYAHIWKHLEAANADSNPELFRLAMKMATGAGKTTVMAMLIAWHTVNAVRSPNSTLFARGFLIVAPGITIRDRLRVLQPSDTENYYATRHLVPPDVLPEIAKAKIVITNYHAFGRRRRLDTQQDRRGAFVGIAKRAADHRGHRRRDVAARLRRSHQDEQRYRHQRRSASLLPRARGRCGRREAHRRYRREAKDNNEAARLWISGIEALKRKVDLRAVYDLSATPSFLRGSGYREGTLFPWVVSDFALIDAIECGIVKLPRVPVSDNAVNSNMPVFRNLWDHIGKVMSKKGAAKAGVLDPNRVPNELQTALHALYTHYEEEYEDWERAGVAVPPVFIVVCNNTANSKSRAGKIARTQKRLLVAPKT